MVGSESKTEKLIDKTIPLASEAEGNEEVSFHIGMKIPEVFGRYSSLDIGIGLKVPGKAEDFEKVVDKYLDRALKYQQETVNQILIKSGQTPYFDHGQK